MSRSNERFTFECPTCGRVTEQNNTVVRAKTRVECLNTVKHKDKKNRIMKVKDG